MLNQIIRKTLGHRRWLFAAAITASSAATALGDQGYPTMAGPMPGVVQSYPMAAPAYPVESGMPMTHSMPLATGCDGIESAGGCDVDPFGLSGSDHCDLRGNGTGIFGNRFLNGDGSGDPFSLFGEWRGFTIGGWAQLGYHSQNLPLFNSRKYDYQLHQAWVYAERAVDGSCGFDLGGRIDYLYGTDGPDTQAFGIANDHWDNDWDNGPDYGHALPQLYLEAAYGDWSAKVGHFYTIIGYEVVAAPDNFFYSHAYTMYNSEPFTHTGALLTYEFTEHITNFGGYVLGWDSGFEDNGDAVLGGSSVDLTDDINVTSTFVVGRFSDGNQGRDFGGGAVGVGERGIMTSTVAQVQLTEVLSYVFQTDYLDTEDQNDNTVRETFGINQYLFRDIGDRLALGARFEWWNVQSDSSGFHGNAAVPELDGDFDVYQVTLGANVRPHSNVIIRPEIRWDFLYGSEADLAAAGIELLDGNDDEQTTFGIDTIFLY